MSEAEQHSSDLKALEDFIVDNPDLERLEALLNQFNIFEAIGVVRQELRHSDFLAFLLNPQENHGLGDAFVKRLLQQAIMSTSDTSAPVSPIELSLWDLGKMEVRREWQHIDILLLDERNRLGVIIENKIGTSEHSDQLRRYISAVRQRHTGYKIVGIYLTPAGDKPSNKAYLPLSYRLVCDVLDSLAQSQVSVLNPDLQVLITHYTEMLRRNIVGDSEIAKLSRQIYEKHERALELIYKHRPDRKMENAEFLTELISDSEELAYKGKHRDDLIFFRPRHWDNVPALNAGKEGVGFFRFVFHNHPNQLILFLEMSPGDEVVRRRLLEMVQKDATLFKNSRIPETNKYPKLYRRTFLSLESPGEATSRNRKREISKQWAAFLENDLPRIEAILKQECWIWESSETDELSED